MVRLKSLFKVVVFYMHLLSRTMVVGRALDISIQKQVLYVRFHICLSHKFVLSGSRLSFVPAISFLLKPECEYSLEPPP